MRSLLPTFALVLSAIIPGQTRQLEVERNRPAEVYLGATFDTFACGDIEGDGDIDCVAIVATPIFGLTNLLLHRRTGTTWQQTTLATYQGGTALPPRASVSLTDLDGDGDLDALVTLAGETPVIGVRIAFLRNDGNAFMPVASVAITNSAWATVTTADVDGDNDRDLVVAPVDGLGQPQSPLLYRHDGAFGFLAQPANLPANPISAPYFADLDGDGDPELVAVDGARDIVALDNQGGTFIGSVIAAGPALHVTAADVDGDGDGDIVAQAADGSARLLRNTPSGFQGFPIATGRIQAGTRPQLVDIDGDQDLDVALVVDAELRILRNQGPSGFATEPVAAIDSFTAADVDQDGSSDLLMQIDGGLAVAYGRAGTVLIDPALRGRTHVAFNGGTTADAVDLDRDGRIDVVQETFDFVFVRRNLGAGEWATVALPVTFLRPSVRAADVDGDGDHDLVVTNNASPGALQVFRLDPGFEFTALPQQPMASGFLVGAGDFDADGNVDVVAVTGAGPAVRFLRSRGDGTFEPPVTVWPSIASTSVPLIQDWDQDQDLDLLIAPSSASGYCVSLFENDGTGSFALANACQIAAPLGLNHLQRLKLADLDNDGDIDGLTWTYGRGNVLMNQGGTMVAGQVLRGVFGSSLLKPWFGDWDDDGDIDILQIGGPPQLWINTGNGTFVDESQARLARGDLFGAGVADIDGDGDPDLLGRFGMSRTDAINHLRSATSLTAPKPGGQLSVRFAHEPGFANSTDLCIPILAFAQRVTPLKVAGIGGTWQLDIDTTMTLPFVSLPAPAGTGESTLPLPNQPVLIGLDLFVQGLILGDRPGFTPALHERVLP